MVAPEGPFENVRPPDSEQVDVPAHVPEVERFVEAGPEVVFVQGVGLEVFEEGVVCLRCDGPAYAGAVEAVVWPEEGA